MKFSTFILFSVVIICPSVCEASKYAEMSNMDKDRPFRMGKINAVWEKARKVLKDKKLTDLYAELVVQDRKLKELKFKKHHTDDVDGLLEAEARRSFVDILNKYNLAEHFPEERQLNGIRDGGEKVEKPELRDDRLKKLWKKASIEGFTEAELKTLKEELSHHQLKLDEFHSLKTDYDVLKENVDNSLDDLDGQDNYWKTMENTKKLMKEKHAEIKEHYSAVKKRMDTAEKEEGEFKDPRVYHLWALAQKSGMSEAELNSMKKELTHFEHRIKKAEHVQDQLNKSEEKINIGGSQRDKKVHLDLQDKAKHYNKKIDKYHEDLKFRIQKRLDEL